MIVQNDLGEDVEVFTKDELEAQLTVAKGEAEKAKQEELERIANEKLALEEENKKLKDKEYNFEQLRKKAESKGVVDEELAKKVDEIDKTLAAMKAAPLNEFKESFVRDNVGDDKEQAELFNHYFSKLLPQDATKADAERAAKEALTLVGQVTGRPFSGVVPTVVSPNYMSSKKTSVSDESKAIGNMFGITEEDRKKYGNK